MTPINDVDAGCIGTELLGLAPFNTVDDTDTGAFGVTVIVLDLG